MSQINASASGTYAFDDQFKVNRLGYGTMQLTGEGTWGPYDDPNNAVSVIKKAVDLGINFFDTADSYGPWFADRYLVEGLKSASNRDEIFISDKVGQTRQGPGVWTPHGEPNYLRQQVEVSLMTLGIDHEDLLFLHRIDSHFSVAEQVGELKKLQDEGKIKHIGLSQVTVGQIKEAQKYAKIDAVENLYNVSDHRDDDVLDYAESQHMAFVPWFPLNTGKLTGANSPLAKIADKYKASPAQIALAWLLKRSGNVLPIPGTSSVAHLEDNVAAASIKLSDDDFKAITNLGVSNR
ncbi:Pyridoxine 4-dehydrogenase [Oenococcus oeni]|uniref:aldo/keto reductase n=1 Tax=Oenococcus oeni TaxID=1247 RepID=UPI001078E33C|nr:aldo/keto reductase [Oenococcus oeni]AVI93738.1 aldo/keto reductase [Oenococcus oeni]SYW00488.1 Pyridoxine 4-dehydrogenase [Oenococcus oeni]SYW01945.1 Pyridoxine 4-dehydrogenase [Oenococcus oeni]SYW15061.1 Pyridoxine 4-dehydrogenase [Oenococcus oeni]SYW18328.1 Pyridoxine 4-dehydrogenase [Oenococcus oeni]